PERVDRAIPGRDEVVRATRLDERVPKGDRVLDRGVQLPPELADVSDPEGPARHVTDDELTGRHIGEVEGRGGERLQGVESPGTPETEARVGSCDVAHDDVARALEVLADPSDVVVPEGRAGHEQISVVFQP